MTSLKAIQRRRKRNPQIKYADTSETRAKLKPDPLMSLYYRHQISSDLLQAGWNIRAAFEIITAPVRLKLSSLEKIDGATVGHVEGRRVQLLLRRYDVWRDGMKASRLATGPILDIVVDSIGLRQCDKNQRVRNGASKDLLIEGLNIYCHGIRATRTTGKILAWKNDGNLLTS